MRERLIQHLTKECNTTFYDPTNLSKKMTANNSILCLLAIVVITIGIIFVRYYTKKNKKRTKHKHYKHP